MELRAPYLFGEGDGGRRSSVTISGDVTSAVLEVAVHGKWSRRLRADVTAGMRKCYAEHPKAVIADLHELDDPRAASVAVWLAARRAAHDTRPPVLLVLSMPPESPLAGRMHRVGAPTYLPMYDTMPRARAAVESARPLVHLLQLRLAPEITSGSAARNLVTDACQGWGLVPLLHPARLVMSELVNNAVEHARTECLVTVSRRGPGLHLSVRDGSSQMPRLLDPMPVVPGEPLNERGQGLRLVHSAATAWGAMSTRDGKTVWAVLGPRDADKY